MSARGTLQGHGADAVARPDPEVAGLARRTKRLCSIGAVASAFFIVEATDVGTTPGDDRVTLLAAILFLYLAGRIAAGAWPSKRTLTAIAHAGLAMSVSGILALAYLSGPTASTATWFLGLVPFIAAHVVGLRAARSWGWAATVGLVALGAADLVHLHSADPLTIVMETTERLVLLWALLWFSTSSLRATDEQIAAARASERTIAAQAEELRGARDDADAALGLAREASRLKSLFLADMSHEIRTPLNGVLGMTELLLSSNLDPDQQDFARTIRSSGEALMTVLDDILDFSKIEAGKMSVETTDLRPRETVEDVVTLFAERAQSKGIELAVWVDPGVPDVVVGDPTRVRQVVSNLVSNAVKFTGTGEVVVTVTATTPTAASPSDATTSIVIEVRDTGIGMSPETEAGLFEAFRQADGATTRLYGGTGLGLAITRRLCELMGGRLGCVTAEGAGTTFTVELPVPVVHEALPVPQPSAESVLAGGTVLVAAASRTCRDILCRHFEHLGGEVSAVSDADAALEQLRALDGTGGGFDLLVAGELGEATGSDLADAVATAFGSRRPRCIVVVEMSELADAPHAVEGSVDATVARPIRRSQLCQAVVTAIEGIEVAELRHVPVPGALDGAGLLGVNLLVVEDNPVNRRIACAQLDMLGAGHQTATNGIEALELLEQPGRRFDAVLLDCQMPLLDGFGVARRLRALEAEEPGRGRTPLIAVTAHAMAGEVQRCHDSGMDDHLAKPYRAEDLLRKVRTHVRPLIDVSTRG